MSKILLVRHGESIDNKNKVLGGRNDSLLTRKGQEEADAVACRICEEYGLTIRAIVSSPLKRAVRTAMQTSLRLGIEIEKIDSLVERSFGTLEGKPYQEILQLPDNKYVKKDGKVWIFDGEGVETFPELFGRAKRVLEILKMKREEKGGDLVVFSHAGLIRFLYAAHHGMGWTEAFFMNIPNGKVFVLEIR